MKLICVGEMVIDFLPGTEEGSYIRKAGGAPANVAVAVARNGLEVGFCGRVGNDDFGRFLVKTLEDNHVAVTCPKLVDEAITTMAFVSLDENGDRSFTFARKPGADMFLTREDVDGAGVKTTADLTEELLLKAMHYGNVAGWLCVQKKGAMESLPTYEQVAAILEAEA